MKHSNEQDRLRFIIERDGLDQAIQFANETMKGYRKAVLNNNHFANTREYKPKFIRSYLSFKEFLLDPNCVM